ncbi:alanine--glyoxylate aminotransferase family protein [Pseudonocardia sp. EV170527-09]|uniref:pyridoxal-phosphate-dependent aminotransferase family protein n=1 Tax=Pseudonocardia sp. EV170527-09 TaxID=2603411 RepID=UPI0011F0ABD9|nr:aminotransferase class V-fold PLP-dependent enzyme [Pseudonocardia sp. EV170527-09]KAA1018277.1 alanine--glyoxylate aminotransferase family protein [Pseudonocardia sp. EV170527-09]
MIPGPCALHPNDRGRLAEQTRAHYGEDWSAFYSGFLDKVGALLDAHSAYLLPGSGSAGLEAAIRNQFAPGQTVVVPDTGFFGARLAEIATALGLRVRVVEQSLGQPVDVDQLDQHLSGADGLACVHVESTTGIRHPIREMAQRARARGLVVVVDGVASAGSEVVQLRAAGIDAFVSASQKGLGGPPGLAVVAFDDLGAERAARAHPRSWYFDLGRWARSRAEDIWEPHPVTMPTAVVRALAESVGRITATGIESWVDGRRRLAAQLRGGLSGLGFETFAPENAAANMITVVAGSGARELVARAARGGIMVAGGLEPLSSAARIGLVGATANSEHVTALLDTLSASR